MNWLYRLFNHDKIDNMQRTIDVYRERTEQLEADVREYKGYKLKYEVTKLYVEDDEGLLELFDLAKKRDEWLSNEQSGRNRLANAAAQQQNALGGRGLGGFGGLGQLVGMGQGFLR